MFHLRSDETKVEVASDYTKRSHVFRLYPCEQAEVLCQATNDADMVEWIALIQRASQPPASGTLAGKTTTPIAKPIQKSSSLAI